MSRRMEKRKGSVLPADGLQREDDQKSHQRAENYASALYIPRVI